VIKKGNFAKNLTISFTSPKSNVSGLWEHKNASKYDFISLIKSWLYQVIRSPGGSMSKKHFKVAIKKMMKS